MGLYTPREPVELKKLIKTVRERLASEGSAEDIDYDSLSVWSFNRLPKYLWKWWKDELKIRGITWQKFLRILKLHTLDMIEWALRETLSWEELVKRIDTSIENYSSRGDING